MPRTPLFNEPSKSISVRVPESKADNYLEKIRKFIDDIYKKELDEKK